MIMPLQNISENVFNFMDAMRAYAVDCEACPPERNCCYNLDEKFAMTMSYRTAQRTFGDKTQKHLMDGVFELKQNSDLRMVQQCPLLTEDFRCQEYHNWQMLGLWTCVEWPISIMGRKDGKGIDKDWISIDYRCHSIEQNWDAMVDRFSTEFNGPFKYSTIIRSLHDEGIFYRSFLEFRELRDQGLIPPQKFHECKP